ncbi:GYD domain-containing protein [Arthrobacter sp. NA-172]|uniref:GYD domain-containing protein n=1 Tax=Arthrobacter sp. NA-172 TaxID=3367524 RepID=UPI003754632E
MFWAQAERESIISKYLFQGNYVGQGIKGLMEEGGSKRRDAVVKALESVGGSLDSIYYAFGETDVLGIFDIPDQPSAVALSLLINSTGTVNLRLTPLLTPEDLDTAASKTPSYRAPGQ